jgi:environmental stress-induced protein Ves
MVRLLTPADYRTMPWKNGIERTIVLHEGAGMRLHRGMRAIELTTPFALLVYVDCPPGRLKGRVAQ